jgi:uncharacterized membrane protein
MTSSREQTAAVKNNNNLEPEANTLDERNATSLDVTKEAGLKLLAKPHEKSWRSLIKAVSWRVTGSLDTFVLALLFTGNVKTSAAIGGAEIATKITLYYLHERAWSRIGVGLRNKNAAGVA